MSCVYGDLSAHETVVSYRAPILLLFRRHATSADLRLAESAAVFDSGHALDKPSAWIESNVPPDTISVIAEAEH